MYRKWTGSSDHTIAKIVTVVVEAVEVAILQEAEVATLVGAEVGEAEAVAGVAHQEVVLGVFQGDSPLEEVVIHPEMKGC
jgi:hypothetical protein